MGDAPVLLSALGAALEQIAAPAFVLRGAEPPVIVHANSAGRVLVDGDAARVDADLRQAMCGKPGSAAPYFVARLASPGVGNHYLAVRRARQRDAAPNITVAAARWSLTRRQAEVLSLLAQGAANKTIAAELRCAEHTVEVHVSALLKRSDSESRSELVARLWGLT